MRFAILLSSTVLSLLSTTHTQAQNVDLVFPPPENKKGSLQEGMLVVMPGGFVDTTFYTTTIQAIQEATNMRLWAVMPAIESKLCVLECFSPQACRLQNRVTPLIAKAKEMGYGGEGFGPNVFASGHSLGAICASTIVEQFWDTPTPYAAFIALDGSGVTVDFPAPNFHINAELAGGLTRPSVAYKILQTSDAAANSGLLYNPVVIIPGISHTSFSPGYDGMGDLEAEKSDEEAVREIGRVASAFIHVRVSLWLQFC